jgi:hypothetical protein
MSAVFTDAAFNRIREIAASPKEKEDLAFLLSVVDTVATPDDLIASLPGTVRLAKRQDADVYVVLRGRLRAVVTVDPKVPDRMVVASIERADPDERFPFHDAALREVESLP